MQGRESHHELCTSTRKPPYQQHRVHPALTVNVTDLLKMVRVDSRSEEPFFINRSDKQTRTPRRNRSVEKAMAQLGRLHQWASDVRVRMLNLVAVMFIFWVSPEIAPAGPSACG